MQYKYHVILPRCLIQTARDQNSFTENNISRLFFCGYITWSLTQSKGHTSQQLKKKNLPQKVKKEINSMRKSERWLITHFGMHILKLP